jgi:hypothetical protein
MVNKWTVLGSLMGIATFSQAVRFCIEYIGISYISAGSDLLDSTNTNNFEYGLLTGPGFLLVYAIVTIPIVKKT